MTKHILLFLTLLTGAFSVANGQCPSGDVRFNTQAGVNNFKLTYPSCTHIEGNLFIIGNDIVNLNGLTNIKSIGGTLQISYSESSLTNIDGLSALESIGGGLNISSNYALTNIDGLSSLTSVGGLITIGSNDILPNLNGLSNLTSVAGSISIGGNYALTNISGLSGIDPETITNLSIQWNPLLSICSLPNFCAYLANPSASYPRSIGNNAGSCINEVSVKNNCPVVLCPRPARAAVVSVTTSTVTFSWDAVGNASAYNWIVVPDGEEPATATLVASGTVSNSTAVAYGLTENTAYDFYFKADCGTEWSVWSVKLDFIPSLCPSGGLDLTNQQEIDDFKINYPSCVNLPGFLSIRRTIWGGSPITNVNGLSNLESIGGGLTILGNPLLTNLDGLSKLTSIPGNLRIDGNNALTNLDGLSSVTSISGDLRIEDNNALPNIDGLSSLTSIGGTLGIYYNNSLTNLSGLSSLGSIWLLSIRSNPVLTSISGLANIDPETIRDLTISYNPLLSVCNLPNFCTYLAKNDFYTYKRYIVYNGANCYNLETVSAACAACNTPTEVSVTSLTATTASFGWDASFKAAYYEWKVVADGANPSTAPAVASGTVSGTTATANGLSENTAYDFYVKTDCGTGGKSGWSLKVDFTPVSCPTGDLNFNTQSGITNFKVQYPSCTHFGSSITVQGSDITNLSGLSNLVSIEGNFGIMNNSVLINLQGFSSLNTIGGNLTISGNSALTHLQGFSALTTIDGDFTIGYSGITSISNFVALERVEGNLSISDNSALTNISGLSSLESVGELILLSNNSLTNLSGLSSLTDIKWRLYISNQHALTHLDGLSSLRKVGTITINGNSQLASISGLSNVEAGIMTFLVINYNPHLSVCNLPSFCTYLANDSYTHPRYIHDNAANCISEAAVAAACIPPCSAAVTLVSPTDDYSSGTQTKQAKAASGKISATNKIILNAKVNYEAASVELLPGFMAEAKNGAVFRAVTGGCE